LPISTSAHNGGTRIEVSLYRVGQGVGGKATWAVD